MEMKLDRSWHKFLGSYMRSGELKQTILFVQKQYDEKKLVYPARQNVLVAFETAPPETVKVVILGQDPYHGPDQAMGLSFSVPESTKTPPSLRNIFKELTMELGEVSQAEAAYSGDLTCWAKQGVLLLNSVLTVEKGLPGSHASMGWESFTDNVIKTVSDKKEHVVFLLWGKYAQEKISLIDDKKHLVLTAPHPSPFSAHKGFFGCDHFLQTNRYLKKHLKQPITW